MLMIRGVSQGCPKIPKKLLQEEKKRACHENERFPKTGAVAKNKDVTKKVEQKDQKCHEKNYL